MRKNKKRLGASLENASAHTHDHRCWSRRSFLSTLGAGSLGAGALISGRPVNLFGQSGFTNALLQAESDRILILIQLDGGNDGLNTIVPFRNDLYRNYRPNLSFSENQILKINDDTGFHQMMNPLRSIYDRGDMAIIQNVSYENQNHSHFRSGDIWLSGSDSEDYVTDGWLGRYIHHRNPDFEDAPPDKPLAVQVGISNQLFQSANSNVGMSLPSRDVFERLVESGKAISLDGIPNTNYGNEMRFLREVANDSYRYADAIKSAADAGSNRGSYPGGLDLAANLAVVARMIAGDLDARVYHLSLEGFDTHGDQPMRHSDLLDELSRSVTAFLDDIESLGFADKVMVMTFSEFGRTVKENGSMGTDHGAGAPLMMFGRGINGGIYGDQPDLSVLNRFDDPSFDLDYRNIYAEVLRDWFGLAESSLPSVIQGSPENLNIIGNPIFVNNSEASIPTSDISLEIFPNPANDFISVKTNMAGELELRIFDLHGREVRSLRSTNNAEGVIARIDTQDLAPGNYIVQLRNESNVRQSSIILQ